MNEVKYILTITEINESSLTHTIFSREILSEDLRHVKESIREFD